MQTSETVRTDRLKEQASCTAVQSYRLVSSCTDNEAIWDLHVALVKKKLRELRKKLFPGGVTGSNEEGEV